MERLTGTMAALSSCHGDGRHRAGGGPVPTDPVRTSPPRPFLAFIMVLPPWEACRTGSETRSVGGKNSCRAERVRKGADKL
jgi:hypothetical protein